MNALARIVDGAVGETRVGLFDGDRPVALDVLRWSRYGRTPRHGETYVARVRTVDSRRRGAFVDLGLGAEAQAFLPLSKTPPREGELLRVRVAREACGGKSAVVAALPDPAPDRPPGLERAVDDDVALREAPPATAEDRERLDAAFEDALSPMAAIPGGGRLLIEPTAALVAVDVDAASRQGPADAERFARDLNLAAGLEALRQLRLRNLGGIVAIDFVSMRSAESRRELEAAIRAAAKADPWGVVTAPLSRFGVMEMSRGRLRPSHAEVMFAQGRPSAETVALEALRGIERAAWTARGRLVVARIPSFAQQWLDVDPIDAQAALRARIGTRWRFEARDGLARPHIDLE